MSGDDHNQADETIKLLRVGQCPRGHALFSTGGEWPWHLLRASDPPGIRAIMLACPNVLATPAEVSS